MVIEDWKQALGQNKYVAAILMDLLKAFDCLPHDLLLLKLKTYGLSENALKLMATNRKQCVKHGNFKNNFQSIVKGVPQGSILGPVLFNIFINGIFHFIKNCKLYNYADDNTVSQTHTDLKRLIDELVEDNTRLIQWSADNQMKANPGKFQAIAMDKRTHSENICFNLGDNIAKCEDSAKLLGVTIDFKLDFDEHISNVCKKASRQLNVLKRIGGHLCKLGKIKIYYYFIMSNFNYCSLTWHFRGEKNTKKIKKIQERALRFIYRAYDSRYESLLIISHFPYLKVRRLRAIALEAFKILNNLSPVYLNDLLTFKNISYSFRYTKTVEILQVRTNKYGTRSFHSTAAKMWNNLPQYFRYITSYNVFKKPGKFMEWRGLCVFVLFRR